MSANSQIVDPLEVFLVYLRACAELVGLTASRIAAKHHFGAGENAWALDEAAVVARLDGGNPTITVSKISQDLDVRFYAPSQIKQTEMWRIVGQYIRTRRRVNVDTQNGVALLYFVNPTSQPAFLYDDDLQLDFMFVLLHAEMSLRFRE